MKKNQTPCRVVPMPKSLTFSGGMFKLGPDLIIRSGDKSVAEYLRRELELTRELKNLRVEKASGCDFEMTLSARKKSPLSEADIVPGPGLGGAYSIRVTKDGVGVAAKDKEGLRNGTQTLLQLWEQSEDGSLPCLEARDFPDLKFRGMHFSLKKKEDFGFESHGQVILFYEWLIRRLARYKYNHIFISPKENIGFSRHPEVRHNPVFSHKEVSRLARLATWHGMKVVPELKCLGKFFIAQPESVFKENEDIIEKGADIGQGACWNTFPPGLDMRSPKAVALIKDCIDEMREIFERPEYFHVAGDESWRFGTTWPTNINRGEKFAEYYNMLNRHLKSKGCGMLMWGDMLLNNVQFPNFSSQHGGPPLNTWEAVKYLDRDIVICDWHYDFDKNGALPGKIYPSIPWFRQQGFDVVGVSWWKKGNICLMARNVAENKCPGLLGSSWTIQKVIMDVLGMSAETPPKWKREELGVFASSAEAAWSVQNAPKIIPEYDAPTWEEKNLLQSPVFKK